MSPGYCGMVIKPGYLSDLYHNIREYQRITSKLNWLTTKTRPDITYATFQLQRQNAAPTTKDMKAAKHLLRYLQGNLIEIILGGGTMGIEAYINASFQDYEDGKSTKAYIIIYSGCPIT